jgi:hypothetical protein
MSKIVYNGCFGGFGLSDEAHELYLTKQGVDFKKETAKWGCPVFRTLGGPHYMSEVKRHDPLLVEVVEELGERANGSCARLRVKEVETGTQYRITDYDGQETIQTRDSNDWQTA